MNDYPPLLSADRSKESLYWLLSLSLGGYQYSSEHQSISIRLHLLQLVLYLLPLSLVLVQYLTNDGWTCGLIYASIVGLVELFK